VPGDWPGHELRIRTTYFCYSPGLPSSAGIGLPWFCCCGFAGAALFGVSFVF
jgi:hypothetical protein